MKNSTENQTKGKLREMKGRVKEGFGVATGDGDMASRGRAEKVSGKVQKKVGDIQNVFED